MKKILIACDSFKECLTAVEACEAVRLGVKRAGGFKTDCIPMADGGEGTMEVLVQAQGGEVCAAKVRGPLGERVEAKYGYIEASRTAIIETAEACGIMRVLVRQRNPLLASTYGVGQLILDAYERGARRMIVGLGGSATNDGGAGMLKALGAQFTLKEKSQLFNAASLVDLVDIDFAPVFSKIKDCEFLIAADVQNPLTGPNGATYVFGKQKGAREDQLELLERGVEQFARLVAKKTGVYLADQPGAGAAGGLGGAFLLLGGRMLSGISLVMELTKFEEKVQGAAAVFTGEGSIDGQTVYGKTIAGLASVCRKRRIPLIAFGGCVYPEARNLYDIGVTALFSVTNRPKTLPEAFQEAEGALANAAENAARLFLAGTFT